MILSIALFYASDCFAIGWSDFELDIGDGYTICKCNSLDVILSKNNQVILEPYDFDNLSPIKEYFVTKEFVFTKNLGRKPRNFFEGDLFQDIDISREFYFIVLKATNEITGPLSKSEFTNHSIVKANGSIKWKRPRNPNFFLPLLGALIVLCLLLIHYFWITIPLLVLMLVLIFKRSAKKRLIL